jgi:glycosyltransferase involved in cell wall biosynthesis
LGGKDRRCCKMVQKKVKRNIMVVLAYPLQEQIKIGHLDVLMSMFKNQLKVFDEVHVVSPRDTKQYNLGKNIYVHSIYNKGARILSLRKDAKNLVKIIEENDIVLIRTLALTSGYSVMLASKKTSVPYIVSIHRDRKMVENLQGIRRNKVMEKLIDMYESKVLKNAALIPVINDYIKNVVLSKGAAGEKITVHPNFVDTKIFRPRKKSKENGKIFFVGRLDTAKGAVYLIEAASLLENHNFKIYIVGIGPEQEVLKKKVSELGLGKKVKFLGSVSHEKELPKMLGEADIFVAPLTTGFTLMEAMSSGVAAIIGNVGWASFVIKNYESGIIVKPHSPEEIATAVSKLLSNKKLCEKIGKNARAYAERNFSVESWKKREIDMYNRVLR